MARRHRSVARRRRAAARSEPWRYGDQCRDGACEGSEGQAARSRRTDRGAAARRGIDRIGRCRRPRLHQSHVEAVGLGGGAAGRAARGRLLWAKHDRCRPEGQRRICLGQSDRADACRPLPRCRVRRRAGKPAGVCRLRGDAGILHQRCRRPGRCAGALGVPALPRGAWRGDRRDPGRALSRRLPQAGRTGAGGGAWRQAPGDAGRRMAAGRARHRHCDDDGGDQGRSRRAQYPARRLLLRAVADRDRKQSRRRDDRSAALPGRRLRRPVAAAERRAGRRL